MRLLSAGLLASFALAAGGCGGGGGGGGGGASAGASLVRSNVLAFVSVNSDFNSSQWHTVSNLVRKFPSGGQLLGMLQAGLASQNVNYKRDIAPALGSEVDFVVSGVTTLGTTPTSASFAVMTKPKDEGKLKKLLAKAGQTGSKPVYRKVNGWYVFSTNQSNIDQAVKKSGKSLNDAGSFKRAMKALPKGALLKAYVSGPGLTNIIKSAASSTSPFGGAGASSLGNLDFLGLALSAENDGIRLVGVAKGGTASSLSSTSGFTPQLVSQIPGDALAVLSIRGSKNVTKQLQKALQSPTFGSSLQQLQAALGVTPQQLFSLLEHEIAFYVRPGPTASGIPELTLLLEAPQEAQELSTIDTLMTRVARLAAGTVTTGAGGVKTAHIRKYGVSYGGFDSRIVISSSATAMTAVQSGAKLSDDPTFKDAKSAAAVPDKTGGFLYVNLKDAVPLIENYLQSRGSAISPTVRDNLSPLKSLFAFASSAGGVGKFTIFLEIK